MDTSSSDLMSLFIRLNKLRATIVNKEMKSLGLTSQQMFLLRELFLEQPRMLSDLSKALELSNSTVTGLVDRLERGGFVSRTRDEKDRRVIWISTTDECNQQTKERFQKVQANFRAELETLFTPVQFDLLHDALEKLIAHTEKMLEG